MNDVVLNKAASIQRSTQRAKEEYQMAAGKFAEDFTRQDAAILNIIRACETALDLANLIIRAKKLGIANTSRESFSLLVEGKIISKELGLQLEKIVAFRNIAAHEYIKLNIDVVESIIQNNLDDLVAFSKQSIQLPGLE